MENQNFCNIGTSSSKKKAIQSDNSFVALFFYQIKAFSKTLTEDIVLKSKFKHLVDTLEEILLNMSSNLLRSINTIISILTEYGNLHEPQLLLSSETLKEIKYKMREKSKEETEREIYQMFGVCMKNMDIVIRLKIINNKYVNIVELIHEMVYITSRGTKIMNKQELRRNFQQTIDFTFREIFNDFKLQKILWETTLKDKIEELAQKQLIVGSQVSHIKKKFLLNDGLGLTQKSINFDIDLSEPSKITQIEEGESFLTTAIASICELSTEQENDVLSQSEELYENLEKHQNQSTAQMLTNKIPAIINKSKEEALTMKMNIYSFDISKHEIVYGEQGFILSEDRKTGEIYQVCYLANDQIFSIKIIQKGVYLASTLQSGIFLIDQHSEIKTRELCSVEEGYICFDHFAFHKSTKYLLVRRNNFKVSFYDLEKGLKKSVFRTESKIVSLQHIEKEKFLVVCESNVYFLTLKGLMEIKINRIEEIFAGRFEHQSRFLILDNSKNGGRCVSVYKERQNQNLIWDLYDYKIVCESFKFNDSFFQIYFEKNSIYCYLIFDEKALKITINETGSIKSCQEILKDFMLEVVDLKIFLGQAWIGEKSGKTSIL